MGLAEIAYQRDELDLALRHASEGIALCRQFVYTVPLANGLATLAMIRQATGDPAGALEAIAEAIQASPGPAGLLNPVPAQRARLLLAQGDLPAATRFAQDNGLGRTTRRTTHASPGIWCWPGSCSPRTGPGRRSTPYPRVRHGPGAGRGPRAPVPSGLPRGIRSLDRGGRGCGRGRAQYAALLPIAERALGPEHPETLAVRGNLADWTGEKGDPAAARDQFAVLLPVRERVLGTEHPDTLITRSNLAIWTGAAGDAAAARDQFAVLLPIRERVLGAEHPQTLGDRADFAYWTGAAGDAAGAGTSTPRCCQSASGFPAPSTPTPWPPAPAAPTGPGNGGCGGGP